MQTNFLGKLAIATAATGFLLAVTNGVVFLTKKKPHLPAAPAHAHWERDRHTLMLVCDGQERLVVGQATDGERQAWVYTQQGQYEMLANDARAASSIAMKAISCPQ